jgi:hypothetical protein
MRNDETGGARTVSELTADLFVSLDGFAGGVDFGPYFGYGGPELEEWINAELDQPQIVVLGRVTYETLATISSNGSDQVFPLTCGSSGRDRIFEEGEVERFELEQTRVLDARVVLLEYRTSD